MKKFLLTNMMILATAGLASAKTIPAGTYSIDAAHSKIGFEIPHLVIATVEGRFAKFDGQIIVDPQLAKSKVNLNVDVASINTENKDRDDHLRSPDFFDATKFPKMTFVAKKIQGSPEDLKIVGDLTIRGKTKQVTLDVKYLGDVNDPFGNSKIVFSATGKISRKDFGLAWSKMVEAGPVVGDEATLILKIEAGKPIEKK